MKVFNEPPGLRLGGTVFLKRESHPLGKSCSQSTHTPRPMRMPATVQRQLLVLPLLAAPKPATFGRFGVKPILFGNSLRHFENEQ